MAVYLVYRNPHESPLGRKIVKFRDKTLLRWFQRNWLLFSDLSDGQKAEFEANCLHLMERSEEIFGSYFEGFEAIWNAMLRRGEPPETERQLTRWLRSIKRFTIYVASGGHAWQSQIDACEIDFVAIMFDDQHAEAHPQRTTYLLHRKQRLPTKVDPEPKRFVWRGGGRVIGQKGKQLGSVFAVVMTIEDCTFLTPPSAVYRFAGVRLPGFVDYLKGKQPQRKPSGHRYDDPGCWPKELEMLRWFAISSRPRSSFKSVLLEMLANHPQSYSDLYGGLMMGDSDSCHTNMELVRREIEVREERVKERQAKRKKEYESIHHPDFLQCSPHFAKVGFRNETIRLSRGPSQWDNRNEAMYFFDDLWAASHPNLAQSLLYSGCEGMSAFKIPNRSWQ
jgi:hypothetical protein